MNYIGSGKTIYQNQNNPDYYYEDQRSKIEQSNVIPQVVSLKMLLQLTWINESVSIEYEIIIYNIDHFRAMFTKGQHNY